MSPASATICSLGMFPQRTQPCRRSTPSAGLLDFSRSTCLWNDLPRRGGERTRSRHTGRGCRVDGAARPGSRQRFAGDGAAGDRSAADGSAGHVGRVPTGRALDGHPRGERPTLHVASLNVATLHHGRSLQHGPLGIRRGSPPGTARAAAAGRAGDHFTVHGSPTHRRRLPAPFADVAFASGGRIATRARTAAAARAVRHRTRDGPHGAARGFGTAAARAGGEAAGIAAAARTTGTAPGHPPIAGTLPHAVIAHAAIVIPSTMPPPALGALGEIVGTHLVPTMGTVMRETGLAGRRDISTGIGRPAAARLPIGTSALVAAIVIAARAGRGDQQPQSQQQQAIHG